MGLAAPKKRTRIGHDPNNTNWTSSTSRYGHRLLKSAGWTPGSTLGAKDAAHSLHYTAGSESHIRIAPCVEGKGLGAKNTTDDTFGLRVLSGLLGRLNGKDTSLIEEQLDRRRGEGYVEQRGWGVHFVFGGFLVGDKIEKERQMASEQLGQLSSKKRKHAPAGCNGISTNKTKKFKKDRLSDVASPASSVNAAPDHAGISQLPAATLEKKASKAQRKELRRLKREKKHKAKLSSRVVSPILSSMTATEDVAPRIESAAHNQSTVKSLPAENTPTSDTSIPLFSGGRGRHAMRHKYIDQKRMACMDEKALNEIFMIKSNG